MKRYYEDERKKYPRTTSIIGQLDKSGPLTQWAANQTCEWIRQNSKVATIGLYYVSEDGLNSARFNFRKVSEKALDIGGQVHKAIELYLKSGEEPLNPSEEVLSGFLAFLEWLDGQEYQTVETEHTVYSDKWAGTLDWLVWLNGELWVIDFKTSKKPKVKKGYPEWGYQTSAYRSETPAVKNGVVRLDKETGYPDFYDLSDTYQQDLEIYNCLVELWYMRNPNFKQEK